MSEQEQLSPQEGSYKERERFENPTQTAVANATISLNQNGVAQQPFVWNDN